MNLSQGKAAALRTLRKLRSEMSKADAFEGWTTEQYDDAVDALVELMSLVETLQPVRPEKGFPNNKLIDCPKCHFPAPLFRVVSGEYSGDLGALLCTACGGTIALETSVEVRLKQKR